MLNRREFMLAGAFASAGMAVYGADEKARQPLKLGISTYSYWHFKTAKVPIETVIDKSAALGVSGVDILHRQMDLDEKGPLTAATRSYCQKLKRHAFRNAIDLICLSI